MIEPPESVASVGSWHQLPPFPPHQTRPSSGHVAPFVGFMTASASTIALAPADKVDGGIEEITRLKGCDEGAGLHKRSAEDRGYAPPSLVSALTAWGRHAPPQKNGGRLRKRVLF